MVGLQSFLGIRIQSTIDTANALHQPDRVPVDVVVDEVRCILQVEALREHVGRDEHSDLV